MIPVQSKYMVVGNGRIPDPKSIYLIPDTKVEEIKIVLPEWFRGYNGRKFIKIYGTQLICIAGTNENQQGYYFDFDTPLEATIHSNIARESNSGTLLEPVQNVPVTQKLNDYIYIPTWGANELINELYDGYVLTANNFYTPKLYEYTNPAITELSFWFKNRYGTKIPIFYVHDGNSEEPLCNFLLFKIECELITL
jgi:hypothetical protein